MTEPHPTMPSNQPLPLTTDLQGKSILIVDDELFNQQLLAGMLHQHGCKVVFASSADEAWDRIAAEPFDAVLLDFIMPDVDGLTFLRKVRKERDIAELPVIMVTSDTQQTRVVEVLAAGANDFITKPIDRSILLARIGTQIRLRSNLVALQDSQERYALASRGSNDGLWDWNVRLGKVFYSERWKSMFGYQDSEIGESPNEWFKRIHREDIQKFVDAIEGRCELVNDCFRCEVRMLHRDGGYRWMMCRGVIVRGRDGTIERRAGSLTDITDGKVGDALTGLPNRLLFLDRLERAIERFQRDPRKIFGVLFLDLDNFKLVNDSLGHQAGDQLLVTIAKRINQCLRKTDTVSRSVPSPLLSRHAGDEFTILLEDLQSPQDLEHLSQRILKEISRPIRIDGTEIVPSFSIGWTISHPSKNRAEDLLREADTAMYQAKAEGRNRACRFENHMRQRATVRLELDADIRRGLSNDEFFLEYQPIVQTASGRILGFEALVRWQHPTRGIVSPQDFIPLAEEVGLIVPLGWQITEKACRQGANWSRSFKGQAPFISINFSMKQFREVQFTKKMRDIIERTEVAPSLLTIEITESALIDRFAMIRTIAADLQEMGARVALDDFGTGYSSLSFLHQCPLDVLKIDRSFIRLITHGEEHRQIVKTIIELGKSLGLQVVAEGVESQEQRDAILKLGCEQSQGFLWSRPMSAEHATALIGVARRIPSLDVVPGSFPFDHWMKSV